MLTHMLAIRPLEKPIASTQRHKSLVPISSLPVMRHFKQSKSVHKPKHSVYDNNDKKPKVPHSLISERLLSDRTRSELSLGDTRTLSQV